MNKTIWKYQLHITDSQTLRLPVGHEILSVQSQNDTACLWALIDPNEIEKEDVIIEMFGTGNPIVYGMGISRRYISTFQMYGGSLVFHAFLYTGV